MNILSTEFTLRQKALEVYLAGCSGSHCPGCHNHESWDFAAGVPWVHRKDLVRDKVTRFGDMIDRIWVLGGEPLDQPQADLVALLSFLQTFGKPVWLFTRREIEDVPDVVLRLVQWVKTGPYRRDLRTTENVQEGVVLASWNQRLHRITPYLIGQKET